MQRGAKLILGKSDEGALHVSGDYVGLFRRKPTPAGRSPCRSIFTIFSGGFCLEFMRLLAVYSWFARCSW
jgi:hypothetical protein